MKPTHKVVVEVSSFEDSPEVHMEVRWEPSLEGKDIEEQGYVPAAYLFVQRCLLAAEEASTDDVDIEDLSEDRTLN